MGGDDSSAEVPDGSEPAGSSPEASRMSEAGARPSGPPPEPETGHGAPDLGPGHGGARVAAARRARAEAAAMRAILLDAEAWPSSAAPHLLEGYRALLDALAPQDEEDGAPLAARLRGVRIEGSSAREGAALVALVLRAEAETAPGPDAFDKRALDRQARLLHSAARAVLRSHGVLRSRSRWAALGAAGVVVAGVVVAGVVALVGGGATSAGDGDTRGWLGRYYPERGFQGEPVARVDDGIEFEWLDAPPIEGVPKDNYSVRWDTCMRLGAEDTLRFRLGSDDGSRLFVDGELVIDSWRDQAGNWASYESELAAGLHHLRVEYYEAGGDALAILDVTGSAGPVGDSVLRPPRMRGGDVSCGDD